MVITINVLLYMRSVIYFIGFVSENFTFVFQYDLFLVKNSYANAIQKQNKSEIISVSLSFKY